jgi:hypothetical protein
VLYLKFLQKGQETCVKLLDMHFSDTSCRQKNVSWKGGVLNVRHHHAITVCACRQQQKGMAHLDKDKKVSVNPFRVVDPSI